MIKKFLLSFVFTVIFINVSNADSIEIISSGDDDMIEIALDKLAKTVDFTRVKITAIQKTNTSNKVFLIDAEKESHLLKKFRLKISALKWK